MDNYFYTYISHLLNFDINNIVFDTKFFSIADTKKAQKSLLKLQVAERGKAYTSIYTVISAFTKKERKKKILRSKIERLVFTSHVSHSHVQSVPNYHSPSSSFLPGKN